MPECCADRGCALPTADTRGLHPPYKSGAPRRSYLRPRQPSVDPALREYPCFPSQSSFAFPEHARDRPCGRVRARKSPVLRWAGLEGPSCLLDVPPKQNNPGRRDLVPLPERKGPAEAVRGLSWKEIKMKMPPVTCKSRPF